MTADVESAEQMTQKTSLLGEHPGGWDVRLTSEFHMTGDADIYRAKPSSGTLPLFEGKMINQFTASFSKPRYWVRIKEGRRRSIGSAIDAGQRIDSDCYRACFRSVASSTNERTMISAILPPCFFGHSLSAVRVTDGDGNQIVSEQVQIFLCAIWNSFAVDYLIRSKVTTNT
jgi:hypothetical protein